MYSEYIKKYYVLIGIILFFISYILFYPSNFMITDAYSYSAQAIAFSQGNSTFSSFDFLTGETLNLIKSPYNLGTATYFSVFALVFGKGGIFIGSLMTIILSVFFLSRSLKNLDLTAYAVSLIFISPPIFFYSRSLMSCLPSLLVISIAIWLFTLKKQSFISLVGIGLLSGLSIWFRETNGLLLFPICLYFGYKKLTNILPIGIGLLIGILCKLLSSYLVYGNAFFASASAGFTLTNILSHSVIYIFILLILFPLGGLLLFFYKGHGDRMIKIMSAIFLFTYILYSYTAVPFSGFIKGTLLTSRFMIPLLPIMVMGFGYLIKDNSIVKKITQYAVIPISCLFIPICLYGVHHLYQPHQKAASRIAELTKESPIIYDLSGFTNTIRYINPLTHNMKEISDIKYLAQPKHQIQAKSAKAFIIVSMSTGNEEKEYRTQERLSYIKNMSVELIEKIVIDEANWIDIYQ